MGQCDRKVWSWRRFLLSWVGADFTIFGLMRLLETCRSSKSQKALMHIRKDQKSLRKAGHSAAVPAG